MAKIGDDTYVNLSSKTPLSFEAATEMNTFDLDTLRYLTPLGVDTKVIS